MVPGRDDGGQLLRGWRPRGRVLATVLFLCGVLLLCHPLVGGLTNLIGLTGTAEYEAVEIRPDGDGLAFANGTDVDGYARSRLLSSGSFDRIGCFPRDDSRECALEAELTDHGIVVENAPAYWNGHTHHDGTFYERVSRDTENGTVIGLRAVSARTVLTNVSKGERDWSEEIETAVDTGSVSAQPPLRSAGNVLERDGNFYVVVHESGPTEPPRPPDRYETMLSVLLGVFAIQYAFRVRG